MENKILIHADINLNIVDGATIWWSNTINMFIKEKNNIIYISNYKIIKVESRVLVCTSTGTKLPQFN